MSAKRHVEVFTAGCPLCEEAVKLVKSLDCPSCEVEILDMRQPGVAERAKRYGARRVPTVVIGGKLADCCGAGAPDPATLKAAGLGQPIN